MKHIFYILLAACLLMSACTKNILNTSPNSQVSSNNMWTTDNLTDQGVAGVYAALRLGGEESESPLLEPYSMDRLAFTGQDYNNGNNDNLLTGTATASTGYFANVWNWLYEGISSANEAITDIPLLSPSDSTKKLRYVAECKFLRAYFYFRLAELYNNVPIYTTITAYNQFTKAASPQDSVFDQCISDLTDAINEPNLPSFYPSGDANWGHATKGAAYALRGEVYMWQKKYTQAIADFQQVKNAGYSLYEGAADSSYKMLFKTAQNECSEMIFSEQNIAVSGYGGDASFLCGTRSALNGNGWNWYSASNLLVDLYENKDGSKFNWDTVIPGYNEMSPAQRQVYFIRNHATAQELSLLATAGADLSKYDSVNNEARIAQAYAGRDSRLSQTIITPYSQYLGTNSSGPQEFIWRFPYRTWNAPTFDLWSDRTTFYMYWYRKFVTEGTDGGTIRDQGPINYPIIRYADVALQWAEAINESQGPNQAALDLINSVRARAGQPDLFLGGTGPTSVAGQSDLRTRIQNERAVEFANEGINYYDELRWGIWTKLKFQTGNGGNQAWGTTLAPYALAGSYITTWPAPAAVVQINPNVAKTPGWTY